MIDRTTQEILLRRHTNKKYFDDLRTDLRSFQLDYDIEAKMKILLSTGVNHGR